jgi:NDP-sugar pyrophosphorylase family protein
MVTILDRPFLEHQIGLLKENGIRRILLCIGHLGEQIKAYFGTGRRFGVQIEYSEEGENRLGTGGALKRAETLLDERFFLLWGDSYLILDYQKIWREYLKTDCLGLMVVYKNSNKRFKSNVVVRGHKIALYDKWKTHPGMIYIDNGLSAWDKAILKLVPPGRPFEIEKIFLKLSKEGEISAYETEQRFYEIGSVFGLMELRRFLNRTKQPNS